MKNKNSKIIIFIILIMTLFIGIGVGRVYADDIYVAPDMPDQADCDLLFGDGKPGTIAYLINEILSYVRVIVPILAMVLGSVDLFKALIASNPDAMKKAQNTFVKRLIFAVAVFFVPAIVNIIMWVIESGLNSKPCSFHFNL